MREDLAANTAILKRLAEIDKTLLLHDGALREIFQKLRPLLEPPPMPPKPKSASTPKKILSLIALNEKDLCDLRVNRCVGTSCAAVFKAGFVPSAALYRRT